MAVIKYSGLVDQLRGKLNGTVFSKFNDGFNSYKKGQPSRWGSADQQRQRLGFSTAAAYWKTATPQFRQRFADKAAHYTVKNRFGEAVHIPAFQYYILISRLKQITGLDFRIEPTTDTPTLTQFTIHPGTSLTITATDQGYIMSGVIRLVTTTTNPAAVSVQLYVSSAVPETEATTRRTHYYVQRQGVPGSQPVGANVYVTLPGTVLPPSFTPFGGNQLELKLIVWTTGSAAYSVPVYFRTGFTYVPPAPPLWDIILSPSPPPNMTFFANDLDGSFYVVYIDNWQMRTASELPGGSSAYEVEFQSSSTNTPNATPIPETITGNEPITVVTPIILTLGGMRIIQENWQFPILAYLNNTNKWQADGDISYKTARSRIRRLADGMVSDWFYYTLTLTLEY